MDRGATDRPRQLLVAGHVNVDRFLTVRLFPAPDRTVPIEGHRVALGGTAATIARVASRFGVASGLVARIGEGFPASFLEQLDREGIDLRGVERVPRVGTPTCYIVEDEDGDQRTLIDQGPMARAARAPLPGRWMGEYAWLHLATGDPAYHLRLARAARRAGLRVAADPAQEIHYRWDRTRLLALLHDSEMLFGNRSEIAHAAGFVGARDPGRLLAHVPLVVRTEGTDGATALSRAGTVHVPARRVRRVRSIVGAGDAFRGGFYAGWFAGEPLRECLGAGVRSAAEWVEGRERPVRG
ncbi:MAG TPA: PfkB family carbohydrate kinase [Thermoplasmata archaeon]|nr:PfkB family carbohydrate kinase [Thermoplasmata archaeon]